MPERQHLVGQVEADLLQSGDGSKSGVAEDEGAVRGGYLLLLSNHGCCGKGAAPAA